MTSTIALPPEHETGRPSAVASPPASPLPADAESHSRRGGRGTPFPDPQVNKLRGLRLVALWMALTVGAWAVLGGAGYGLYLVVHSFLL